MPGSISRKGLTLFVFDGKKSRRRLAYGCCFVACLLMGAIGCQGGVRRSAQHTQVTGTVTYNGKPLPGGQIKFVGDDWVSGEGVIDENGSYSVDAPIGKTKISIDNRLLREGLRQEASKGAGPRPGADAPTPLKGKYVEIPQKYYDPTSSGLEYTVKKGPQTFDIPLTN